LAFIEKGDRTMRKTIIATILSLVTLCVATNLLAQDGRAYKVIVHPSNPISSLSKSQLSRYFLKKQKKWKHGPKVEPVDQKSSSRIREVFSREILNRSATAVTKYWQQQIFSGRDVPPPEKGSDNGVVSYVLSNKGGIGYVSATANTSRTKVIQITN